MFFSIKNHKNSKIQKYDRGLNDFHGVRKQNEKLYKIKQEEKNENEKQQLSKHEHGKTMVVPVSDMYHAQIHTRYVTNTGPTQFFHVRCQENTTND